MSRLLRFVVTNVFALLIISIAPAWSQNPAPSSGATVDSASQRPAAPGHVDSSAPYDPMILDQIVNLPSSEFVCPIVTVLPQDTLAAADRVSLAVYIWLQLQLDASHGVVASRVVYCSDPGRGFEERAQETVQNQKYGSFYSTPNASRWLWHQILFVAEPGSNLPDSGTEFFEIPPEMTHAETPEYPRQFMRTGDTGTVWVKALIDENGSVRAGFALKSSGRELFDCSAVLAAFKSRFNNLRFRTESQLPCGLPTRSNSNSKTD